MSDDSLARELEKKAARKATPGGGIKWVNIPRNWIHQAVTYMDTGELSLRIVVEAVEVLAACMVLASLFDTWPPAVIIAVSFVVVHTWNWVTNGLFWAVIIFTFPSLRNPGAGRTCEYLNDMATRLSRDGSVTALAVYGSIARGGWHDRSDIDIRIMRAPGFINLVLAGLVTMRERFIALLVKQPMDLYLADNTDFLRKLRSDERPILLLEKNDCLRAMYPSAERRLLKLSDLVSDDN